MISRVCRRSGQVCISQCGAGECVVARYVGSDANAHQPTESGEGPAASPPAGLAMWIVEEVVGLFNEAREAGLSNISSMVGSKFECRARNTLAALEAANVDAVMPEADR